MSKGLRQLAQPLALHPPPVNQLPKQIGRRTRKDGFQAASPFGSYLCAGGGREWRPGWEGVGGPGGRHLHCPGHRGTQAGPFVGLGHESGSMDGLPRSLRPQPQRSLWELRGRNDLAAAKSYCGKSDPFTWALACWLCGLRQKQPLPRQQIHHRRERLCDRKIRKERVHGGKQT